MSTTRHVDGWNLATWTVIPGGESVSIGFRDDRGETHRIVLAFEALNGLLMTLPRMLQSALDERFPDGTLRVVHPLGDWRLEQPEGHDGLILKLGTRDGFEVAFAVPDADAGSLGTALLTTSAETPTTLTRRPN